VVGLWALQADHFFPSTFVAMIGKAYRFPLLRARAIENQGYRMTPNHARR